MEWIDVKDKLPEDKKRVLVHIKARCVQCRNKWEQNDILVYYKEDNSFYKNPFYKYKKCKDFTREQRQDHTHYYQITHFAYINKPTTKGETE